MKITKTQLRQIIKEELSTFLSESAIYTPGGAYQVLDPNNPDDYEAFYEKAGIKDPKAEAEKSLNARKGSGLREVPYEGERWMYLAYANKNKNQGWEWYDPSKAIDVLPNNTYSAANFE